jgi:hypothetical protein
LKRLFQRREALLGAALFVLLLAVYGGVYLLWLTGHEAAYLALTRAWGIDTWYWPFLDLHGVLSWAECHRRGIDVLRTNPCDVLGRPLNYGPPLLYLPFGLRHTTILGLTQSLLFLAALPFVLRPRTWRQWAVAAAASLSTATLFALERGNLDLSEFVLVALGCAFAGRGVLGRLLAYTLYFLGGVVKFYPFVLLLLVLRERIRLALALAAGFAVLIFCYAVHYWKALVAIAALMPKLSYEEDTFGATLLGFGLSDEFGWSRSFAIFISILAFAAASAFALWLASALRRGGRRLDFNDANMRHLLAGAVIIICCFVLQTNITYRAIFLLFLLPGLAELRADAGTKLVRRVFGWAIFALMFCLWSECLRRGLESGLDAVAPDREDDSAWNNLLVAFFVGREIVWWSLMATTFSVILVFLRDCPLGAVVFSRLARPRARPAA